MEALPASLDALKKFNQFILFFLSPSKTRQGKFDKLPIDYRTGCIANAHDSAIWLDADSAITYAKIYGANYDVGFVFTENDPFWFLDIDNCLDDSGDTPKWNDIATYFLKAFNGAAVEVSSSEKGLHIIGSGKPIKHSCKNSQYNIEFYTTVRFVALTGLQASGDAGLDCSHIVEWLVQNFFPASTASPQHDWTNTPCIDWNGPSNDDELLERALRSRSGESAFGDGISFRDLWERNEPILANKYSHSDKPFDESRADAALAKHLAFWTGNDCERIRRLMEQSKLKREKWQRESYLIETIKKVCGSQKEFLNIKTDANKSTATDNWVDVSIHDIFTNPPEPLLFLIEHWLPAGLLTLLSAHGGSGKSMMALQAAICLAMGLPFMGKKTIQSRVVFFSAEDAAPIIRQRLIRICRHMGIDPQALATNLKIIDATYSPCLYAENMAVKQKAEKTIEYEELNNLLILFNADALVIDNASDTFDANENNRANVRGFIRSLLQFGKKQKIAVLLLAHIDKHTARGESNSSEGYSGSTAWHNSARSRLFLNNEKNARLILHHQKSNHGILSPDTHLTWSTDGVLTNLTPANTQDTLNAVLALIKKHSERGNYVSTAPTSPTNPFKILRADHEFPSSISSNAELMKILYQAEDSNLLIRKNIPAKRRGETREIFMIANCADLSPT